MAVIIIIAATFALGTAAAEAAKQRSSNVAIVLGEGTGSSGNLQTSGAVAGSPGDSFEAFAFTDLTQEQIEPATLAQYDTVVLNQVFTSSLTESQKQALASFVTSGGKLIVHDADGTHGNEYSWLPVPANTGETCENCGNIDGEAEVVENNTIVSDEPASPYYVNVGELPGNSDAVGDANVLLTSDPRWTQDIRASNSQNVEGAVDAYASDGGLILYNGFDDDGLGPFPSLNDWLDKIWYDELNTEWDPDNLPHSVPVVGSGGHCGFRSIRVGVATVCAESITGSGTETTATGHVVLDEGVSVGEGPITIDREAKKIAASSPAPIALLRSTGSEPIGTAAFSIDATGTADPISGKTGLAAVSLSGATLGPLGTLRAGGVPFAVSSSAGSAAMYLDSGSRGGLIATASLQLAMLGKAASSGAVSLGFYAGASASVTPLGGSAHFGAIELGRGWKFGALDLTFQQPTQTWTASGGLDVPIASLQASGSVIAGRLDSLHVAIGGQNVPLGDSGFFFSGFGGGFSGLANGPLKVDASTEGFWGAPKLPVEPFYLDNVTVTVSFNGSVSLDGAVSFAFKDHSPLHGSMHLGIGINPFSAGGTAVLEGELPGLSVRAHGGVGFTSKHFTAAEGGSLKIFGLSGSGEAIVSDRGLGASGTLCAPFHVVCQTMAIAGSWQQIGRLDIPSLVGGEPRRLITVSGIAAGQAASFRVPAGRHLLLITATRSSGGAHIVLHAPSGKRYDSTRPSKTVVFNAQPSFGLTTAAVIAPRPGVWRVSSARGEQATLHFAAQTVQALRLIRAARISHTGSARRPLSARTHVLLRWASAHLPSGVRVAIVRHAGAHEVGVGLVGNLPAHGHLSLPVTKLAVGRNYITLAATLNGVPFQQATFKGAVWRAASALHRPRRSRRKHKR